MYRSPRSDAPEAGIDTRAFYAEVLVVLDRSYAPLLCEALERHVGTVLLSSSVADALSILQERQIDLLVSGIPLPDSSGLALIRGVAEVRPLVPVVAAVDQDELGDAVAALREGAWDFLVWSKIDNPEQIDQQIASVLERSAQRKLQALQEMRLRAERDAFYVAALSAQDGLAILSENGNLLFGNDSLRNFVSLLKKLESLPVNILEIIGAQNELVAQDLALQLQTRGREYLWKSELEVNIANASEEETGEERSGAEILPAEKSPAEKSPDKKSSDKKSQMSCYELTLLTVTPRRVGSLRAGHEPDPDEAPDIDALPESVRYHVLWVRDITRRKEQERFQRDLLSTTTHDLKGPLSAILASAELLTEPPFSPNHTATNLLTRIASCARNSIDIIDELLSARRIQDGVLVVKPRYYLVDEILEDTVLDYLPLAKAKNIKFSARPVERGLEVFADKQGLNRVLGNLVGNALKFTPHGGKVELSAKRLGRAVRFFVRDTGPGIDAHSRHKLFEKFTRLEKYSDIEGTGLGLFVSKNIIHAHNGKIEVQSESGQGTMFIVTLPDEDAEL